MADCRGESEHAHSRGETHLPNVGQLYMGQILVESQPLATSNNIPSGTHSQQGDQLKSVSYWERGLCCRIVIGFSRGFSARCRSHLVRCKLLDKRLDISRNQVSVRKYIASTWTLTCMLVHQSVG
jgi:hypothetical protein